MCDNCVIAQDGVISARRGYSSFATGGVNTLNNLFFFQGTLLALYNNQIAWLDANGTQSVLTPYSGVSVSESGGRIGRSVEANSNLYWTSDNGALKLEAFNGTVQSAGVPPALDLRANFIADSLTGPIGIDNGHTQVGWRATFGRIDSNQNLLESAPSDITVLTMDRFTTATAAAATWDGTTVTFTLTNHGLSTGNYVTVSNATAAGINGVYQVSVTGANTFTYPNATIAGSGTADLSTAGLATRLEFSVPSEIQDMSYFWRLYRTSQSVSASASPTLDFKLIKQQNLTSTQLTNRVVFFDDTILDIFQASAAELYTNPNSEDGELQANTRPPLCADVTFYKNHTFYANTTSRHLLEIAVVSTSGSFLSSGSSIRVKLGSTTRQYFFRTGVGNSTARGAASGTTTITVTYAAHGLLNGDTVYISNVAGTVPEGPYVISGVAANTFQFTSTGNTATALDFQGVTNTGGFYIAQLINGAGSAGIDATARGIVKAIDRDPSSLIYANYASTPAGIPGAMIFQAKGFGTAFSFDADSVSSGQAFSPALPDSFISGQQVTSVNNVLPNVIFSSKIGEPESVPIVNSLPIGKKNYAIQRIVALRDCCIVIKEDGIFRLDGDSVNNFVSTILDSTVFCLVPQSVGLIDNTVMMLANQGVVKISSSAVQIVSYNIEQVIRPILGAATLVASTSAVTYESERLYLLTTLAPNTTTASTVYCYNTLSNCWTTWDTLFINGIVGPVDKLFLISTNNAIAKERKNQNKLDYTAQDSAITIVSVAANGLSAVVTAAFIPQANDIIVAADTISRIKTVFGSGGTYTVSFYQQTNLTAAASARYYAKYVSTIKFAPFHGGQVNRMKQFAQFQLHMRDNGASLFDVSFSNDTFGSSETVTWDAISTGISSQGGWGFSPWGLFPWGQDSGINLTYITQPGPIVRTYVPRFAQRSTFIQAMLTHAAAGERLGIQEIAYSVRGYGERVSK